LPPIHLHDRSYPLIPEHGDHLYINHARNLARARDENTARQIDLIRVPQPMSA
jgi:hypothetical protein